MVDSIHLETNTNETRLMVKIVLAIEIRVHGIRVTIIVTFVCHSCSLIEVAFLDDNVVPPVLFFFLWGVILPHYLLRYIIYIYTYRKPNSLPSPVPINLANVSR
jgi:hypothetical protein